jgi:2'-5' RNA ligase
MTAVDVILLPPPDVMEKAMDMNAAIQEAGSLDIALDREKCLPHITIAMGCVKEEDIPRLVGILSGIAGSFAPIKLEAVASNGGRAWIRLVKTRDIELLHEIVMIRLSPFFNYKVSPEMIYRKNGREIHDLTMDYIRSFPISSSFENFTPHITVGTGEMDLEVKPFSFVCAELALCHLGDFCTCRNVLSSHRLSLDENRA